MYLENRNPNRSNWKYTYTGEDLLEHAKRLVGYWQRQEADSRNKLADLLRNTSISTDSREVVDAKRAVETAAVIHEECKVFAKEFSRARVREFHLSASDVVFFTFTER